MLFVLFLSVASTAAASPVVFAKTYALNSGAPNAFNDSIAVNAATRCGGHASFSIVVQDQGVSSGSVTLNGQTVVSQSDFNANANVIERPVALADTNDLTVRLNGGARGASISVSIVRIVETPVFGSFSVNGGSTQSASFNVSNPSATYYLFAQDGSAIGVRNAVISVNGTDILTAADFSQGLPIRKRLTLQSANTISARVNGSTGSSLKLEVRQELGESACDGTTVKILFPAAGTILNDRHVIVRGTMTGGTDVGVTVNGIVAAAQYDASGTEADPFHWTATIVPPEGNVTLDAVAKTSTGASAEDKRDVFYAPDGHNFIVTPFPTGGPAPLAVAFSTSPLNGVTQMQIDYDGDGVYDYTGPLPYPAQYTYATPGERVAIWRATMADGSVATGSAAVTVQTFAVMDALLQKQWNLFADALASGNIEAALTFLAGIDVRARYRDPLTLIRPNLARYAAGVREIHPISISGRLADYLLIRQENGIAHGYHIYFLPDADGIWKIAQF